MNPLSFIDSKIFVHFFLIQFFNHGFIIKFNSHCQYQLISYLKTVLTLIQIPWWYYNWISLLLLTYLRSLSFLSNSFKWSIESKWIIKLLTIWYPSRMLFSWFQSVSNIMQNNRSEIFPLFICKLSHLVLSRWLWIKVVFNFFFLIDFWKINKDRKKFD